MSIQPLHKLELMQFASQVNITDRHLRRIISNDEFDNRYGDKFTLIQLSPNKKYIVPKEAAAPKYKHPTELTAETIVEINKLLATETFQKKNGKPNIARIAEFVHEHYWTIKRYLEGNYKKDGENRADKGQSRKFKSLTKNRLKELKGTFEWLLLKNCQRNVALTIEKVEMNEGILIPERIAYRWAHAFLAAHKQSHYLKKFIMQDTPHVIRDLWTEYPNFLDCVVADEWKIDEFGVMHHYKEEGYEEIIATAYAVIFQDMKTRKPVGTVITPHSTTTADTVKAAMQVVRDYGRPKKWLFENAKTWKNEQFLRFILGLYEDDKECGVEFLDYDHLVVLESLTDEVTRTRVGRPEGKPVERTFRIIKDEFCAYSESYSPNMEDSRKPELMSAHPEVTRTFEELYRDLTLYLENDFLDRKRVMFYNRMLSYAHPENKQRPRTIRVAFDIAYATYEPEKVDELKLAYLYGEKFKRKFVKGMVSFIYPTSAERLSFIPVDIEAMYQYVGQNVVLLVNQYNVHTGWFFDMNRNLICGAKDLREFGSVNRERANELGKLARDIQRINRRKVKKLEEYAEAKKIHTFAHEKTMADAVEYVEKQEAEDRKPETEAAIETKNMNDFLFDDESLIIFNEN